MKAWIYVSNWINVAGYEGVIQLRKGIKDYQGYVQILDGDGSTLIASLYQEDMDKLAKRWLAMRAKANKPKRKKVK